LKVLNLINAILTSPITSRAKRSIISFTRRSAA
jgi:hypothetical protein